MPKHPPHVRILLRHIALGHIEVKEIAAMLGRSLNHIYRCHEPDTDTEYRAGEIFALARYLSDMGYNELAECGISPRYQVIVRGTGEANGCVDDELADYVSKLGQIKLAHGVRDRDAVLKLIQQLPELQSRLVAEAERL